MSTKIEWCEETWNPVTGCTAVSAGCEHCYAKRMANRLRGRYGYPQDEPFKVTLHPGRLDKPLHWKKPRHIFVCSMGDLFHRDVPFEFIDRVWTIMLRSPDHTFLVLTKRPERMMEFWEELGCYYDDGVLPNLWLGVSVENQKTADERIPILLQIPAAVRFVSVEPMLGPVDLIDHLPDWDMPGDSPEYTTGLDWVICGGESGPGARPMHPDWARQLRDDCVAAGVPFFFKQWGEWAAFSSVGDDPDPDGRTAMARIDGSVVIDWQSEPNNVGAIRLARVGKKKAGRELDNRLWEQYPVRSKS